MTDQMGASSVDGQSVSPVYLGEFFWTSTDLMSILGADGNWLIVNSAWPNTMGWSLEDLRAGPFVDLIHPDDVDKTMLEFKRLLSSPDATLVEFVNRQRHRDGSYHWIEWSCQGRDGLVFSAGRDITERVRDAAILADSLAVTRAVLDAAPDSIIVIDEEFTVIEVSPGTERIYGIPQGQRYGRSAMEVVDPRDRQRVEGLLRQLFEGNSEELTTYRFRAFHIDGGPLTMETRARRLRQVDGLSPRAVLVSRDISDSVAVLEDLESAKEYAESHSREKTEFMGRMSHELRTPLTAVLGFAEIMQMEPHTPDQGEMLEYIRVSGQHLLALVDDVLDVSRVESGSINLRLEPVSLSEIVEECISLFMTVAKAAEVEIIDRLDSCFSVTADRQRLRQVVVNLVSNAVKYNQVHGSVIISGEQLGATVRLSVVDTGVGISQEHLARLFTPFDRLDAVRSGVEGTGLGLSLSKNLANAMGGSLGVSSMVGMGSTFWIDMPMSQGVKSEAPVVVEHDTPAPDFDTTILYIDDTTANLRLVEHLLGSRPGVRVITATLGQEGLELAARHHPDLILLDAWLPDLHGVHVLRQLRSDPATASIPVVVVSADSTSVQRRRFADAGVEEFMVKPLDLQHLLEVVDAHRQDSTT